MTINCKGKLIDLSTPKVMGILNVTPDSFYDKSRAENQDSILQKAEQMLEEGAHFIDIGGYSSRPGADDVSVEEETERVVSGLEIVLNEFPESLISVDTFRSEVAKVAIETGACIVNDISAGQLDKDMIPTVGELQVPYIMMHMRSRPQDMQKHTQYDDLIKEILFYFSEKLRQCREHKINDIIIDPGFGFAKTTEQNFEILAHLDHFQFLELPILVGLSRKSMIYKTLGINAQEALNGTTALNSMAVAKGANILRVHDVKAAKECIHLVSKLQS